MKGWIINYTTLKNGEYKGWGMYITADSIISACQAAELLIRMHPDQYDRYVITDVGITDNKPGEQKWEEKWSKADTEDF